MVVTDSSSSMVDEKKKNAPLDSLHDFIPPAFAGDCTHPYSINVNYQELERDEIEFTYTLKWRGKSIPSRLTEIPGLLAEQLPVKAARDSSKVKKIKKKSRKLEESAKKTKKMTGGLGTSTPKLVIGSGTSTPKQILGSGTSTPQLVLSDIEGSLQNQSTVSSLSHQSADAPGRRDSLQQLRLDLYNNFNCPRYYYSEKKLRKAKKIPVIHISKPADDVSSNRSYFDSYRGTPRKKKTLLREGWIKEENKKHAAKKKTPKRLATPPSVTGTTRTERSSYNSAKGKSPTSPSCSLSGYENSSRQVSRVSSLHTATSDRCDVTQSSGSKLSYSTADPYIEDQVLLNLTLKRPSAGTLYLEQFLPVSMILHDAVDEILKKANRRILLKSSKVSSVIYLGHKMRPLSNHEYYCKTLEELMAAGQEVNITVDMRKK